MHDLEALQRHAEDWLAQPTLQPCWVTGDPGVGKTRTLRSVLEAQERFRWTRWSAADPGFLEGLRARLQTPRRSVQSFFRVLKPELIWIDDLEASVHPWRHTSQLVRETWAKCQLEGIPLLLSGGTVHHPIFENVAVSRFDFPKPEEPSILQRVASLLFAPHADGTPSLEADTMAVYHGHRIFVPLLVLEAVHQSLSDRPDNPTLHRAIECLYLSDHVDALWRTCSNDELLKLHAWLAVALPRHYLQTAGVAPFEPRFTPYPGRCTARNSLRKHWLEVLLGAGDPWLRGHALDERLLQVWAEIKTRGVKKVDTQWKRTNLTAILTNSGSRARRGKAEAVEETTEET